MLDGEGIVPAPEWAHAIRSAIDEALAAREAGEARVILLGLSGHGFLDLGAYEQYFNGELEDYEYPAERIEQALAALPAPETTPHEPIVLGWPGRLLKRASSVSVGRD